jgi:uncharacterized membrane protein
MKTEETFFTFFLLVIVALMVTLTFGYRPGARLVPLIIGICTLALMVSLCVMIAFPGLASRYQKWEEKPMLGLPEESTKESFGMEKELKEVNRKKERSVVGWLVFLSASTYVLGFLIAIPLFLFLFLKLWAHEGWVLSLCMSGVVLGFVFFIFVFLLHVPLHQGIIFL